jgi:RNA polymerase-binding transcription factor DksA
MGPMALTKKDLKRFEQFLNEKKEKLLQELGYLESSTLGKNLLEQSGDLSGYAYHLADQAADAVDREHAFAMASRESRYLLYLNEALDRIKNGTFGICKKCKDAPHPKNPDSPWISTARLEAVPTATLCIWHKQDGDMKGSKEA